MDSFFDYNSLNELKQRLHHRVLDHEMIEELIRLAHIGLASDGGAHSAETVAREIAIGCNLDPDAISPKTALTGHSIPEWVFFVPAAQRVIALKALPSNTVKIKDLEWREEEETSVASTSFGDYFISYYDDVGGKGWTFRLFGQFHGNFNTRAEAKSAARTDYESRIHNAFLV